MKLESLSSKHAGPTLPIPEPLRGVEAGTFAHYTVTKRMPDIARQVLKENDFSEEAAKNIKSLIEEIPDAQIRPLEDRNAPDEADWASYVEPYLGQNWLEVPWFFAETYFYRRILEATGFFGTGSGQGLDPYIEQKRQGLEASRPAIRTISSQQDRLDQKQLARLLNASLWGNQADLSMWSLDQERRPNQHNDQAQQAHLLVNHAPMVANHLLERTGQRARIDFILDNIGMELVNDLSLADSLLQNQIASIVNFHLKVHPTYVSDATIRDVQETISALGEDSHAGVRAFSQRLKGYLESDLLHLVEHLFWTSPLSFWELPAGLRQDLASADLLISKGDANYRRLLGDRHWPFTTPLEEVWRYLPTNLVALRVIKAEVAVGLPAGLPEKLHEEDAEWLFDGNWGLIQFRPVQL